MNVFVLWGACWTGRKWSRSVREFAISRKTGYKIFDRYKEYGLEALTDRSRRPWRYGNQLPQQVEAAILTLKREEALLERAQDPRTLAASLSCEVKVPARSTIHAVLDRHGLVQRRGPRRNHAQGTPCRWGRSPTSCGVPTTKASFCWATKNTATR